MESTLAARVAFVRDPGAIRVTVPAEVAFNLNRFNAGVKNLAERIGHPNCISGVNCQFLIERDFLIDPAGQVHADPNPQPSIFIAL